MKTCTKCLEAKDFSEFNKRTALKDGHSSWCKACVNLRAAGWRDDNRDEMKNRARDRYDPEKQAAKMRKYNTQNPDARKTKVRSRRLKLRVINELKPGQWAAAVVAYGGRCLHPNCDRTDLTQDHVIPLSKGGRHHISNLQTLCASHNAAKHVRVADYRAFVITG